MADVLAIPPQVLHQQVERAPAPADRRRHHRARRQAQRARSWPRSCASRARRCARRSACWPPRAWSRCCPTAARSSCSCRSTDIVDTFEVIAGARGPGGRARLPAHHDAELDEIRALHFEMLAAHTRRDLPTYYRLNAAIHSHINAAARNAVLAARSTARSTRACRRCASAPTSTRTSGRARCASTSAWSSCSRPATALALRAAAGRAPASTSATPCSSSCARRGDAGERRVNAPRRGSARSVPPRGTAARLARRAAAARRPRGEVLFDAASRGRYATDASIYQVDAGRRRRAAQRRRRRAPRSTIARDAGVPIAAARRRHLAVRPDRRARRWSSTSASTCAACVAFDADARRPSTVEPGIVLDQLNAWLKPHGLWFPVDVSTTRAGDARRHGRQQLVRLALDRLRQHGAQRRSASTPC